MGEIIMPKVGDAMTEGKVVRWYKKAGDAVKVGEPVVEIETDKVNLDLEAEEDGVLDDVSAEEGVTVEVGHRLAWVRGEGEEAPPAAEKKKKDHKQPAEEEADAEPARQKGGKRKASDSGAKDEQEPAEQEEEEEETPKEAGREKAAPEKSEKPEESDAKSKGEPGRTKSSPLARRMAKELGVDLQSVSGSGPAGRIIAVDVKQAAGSAPKASPATAQAKPAREAKKLERPAGLEEKDIPLTAMRRTIAKRLVESLGPVPHFFLTIEADVTSLLELRRQLNEVEEAKASVNDFVVRAAALAILHHPVVNSSFGAEEIRQHGQVDIGIAVATPEGLITPIVRSADGKSVLEIAGEVRALAEKAKNRKLKPEDYQGSTFTISNLGMFGIEEFTAIINPPNAAILAVGAAKARPVVIDGEIAVRETMRVTLSCDHRVIDGAAGAQFLQTLQQYLEQPLRLIL